MRSTPSIFREQISGQTGHGADSDGHGEHHGLAHVISPIVLVTVFALLMVLTLITVAVTAFDFGYKANLIVALVIACVKAFLVVAYFMHLRYDNLFYTAIFGICVVFIGVFIITTMLDSDQYQPILAPRPVTAAP